MTEPEPTRLQSYKCPVCDGQGKVSRPPWVAGDQQEWSDTSMGPWPCHACKGMGVLPEVREPSLELTEAEWEWARNLPNTMAGMCAESRLLTDYLLRLEAAREKLLWQEWHSDTEMHIWNCQHSQATGFEKHNWTSADWLKAVWKKRMGE